MNTIRILPMILIVSILSGCAALQPPPSFRTDPLYWTAQAGVAYDLLCQTTQIHKTDGIREMNPLLSEQPSYGEVIGYWAISALATHVVYTMLKERWEGSQHFFGAAVTINQGYWVHNNHELGLKCW